MKPWQREILLIVSAVSGVCVVALWSLFLLMRVTTIRGRSTGGQRCPKCGVRDVRPAMQRGVSDVVYCRFGCAPYRCRLCGARFHLYQPGANAHSRQ